MRKQQDFIVWGSPPGEQRVQPSSLTHMDRTTLGEAPSRVLWAGQVLGGQVRRGRGNLGCAVLVQGQHRVGTDGSPISWPQRNLVLSRSSEPDHGINR